MVVSVGNEKSHHCSDGSIPVFSVCRPGHFLLWPAVMLKNDGYLPDQDAAFWDISWGSIMVKAYKAKR
jgi:hypothetical protein